jgi:hypothetical protein
VVGFDVPGAPALGCKGSRESHARGNIGIGF